MADIDQILAGGSGASTAADFSGIGKLPELYYKARDEAAKNDLRDAFKGGLPMKDGQPDFAEIGKVFFQKGGFDQGIAASNLGITQQKLQYGKNAGDEAYPSGGPPSAPARTPIVSPPSPSRPANSEAVVPALNKGGEVPQGGQGGEAPRGPQGDQPGSIMGVISAAGIPDELAGPIMAQISAQTKIDPNVALPPDIAPRVQQAVQAYAQRIKAGQPQGSTGLQPQPQQAPPQQVAQASPDFNSRFNAARPGQGSDPTLGGLVPPGRTPAQQMDLLSRQITSGNLTPEQAKLNLARIEAIKTAIEPTGPMKEYDKAVSQGYKGTMRDSQTEAEADKAAAIEEAKMGAKKYESLVEAGTKAQMEIPQLDLLKEQMNDPNFFSGAGEKYNLLYKRLKSAVGIDPEAAVPQEYLRKATAANVLSSLGALKGLGQIRVAEINMAREAAASPENSVPANKLLVEISKRTHQRNADIAEKAQDYKEKNGKLDAGFDKQVTAYYKANPLFTDGEIKDWHNIIRVNIPTGQTAPPAQSGGAQQRFSSPSDVHAAVASGKLKSGDSFLTPDGKTKYVP